MLIEFNLDFRMQNYKKISKNERNNTEILFLFLFISQ